MTLKGSLAVLLSGHYRQGTRLLEAAEGGQQDEVSKIVCAKPSLAAFAGFGGSGNALHRAAATGSVDVCRAILEPIQQKAHLVASGAAAYAGCSPRRSSPAATAARWRHLLAVLLGARDSRGLTPLMVACEKGHAAAAAYLLRQGSNPRDTDWAASRTCLHLAACGGHTACVALLCSESTVCDTPDGPRAVRDLIVDDPQVGTCRLVDARSYGGLTALHYAAVAASLGAVQVLLRGGAATMVKTDGDAYIGAEFLAQGSTPLHIAAISGNISVVHAILQAHAELMNSAFQSLDERGRRAWEAHSRTDVRSARNALRRLPFHLARERANRALSELVDPRVPVDVALDAARDTEHGIGPKRLSTLAALVLQRRLLAWLEACEAQVAVAKQATAETKGQSGEQPALGPGIKAGRPAGADAALCPAGSPRAPAEVHASTWQHPGHRRLQARSLDGSPAAGGVALQLQALAPYRPPSPATDQGPVESHGQAASGRSSLSAPPTPARPAAAGAAAGTRPAEASSDLLLSNGSLQAYIGLLSLRVGECCEQPVAGGADTQPESPCQPYSPPPAARPRAATTDGLPPRPPSGDGGNVAVARAGAEDSGASPNSITVMSGHRRAASSQSQGVFGALSTLRVRLRSQDDAAAADQPPQPIPGAHAGAALLRPTTQAADGGPHPPSGKDVSLDAKLCGDESTPSEAAMTQSEDDVECGVCLDRTVDVAFAGCEHQLCLACARHLTSQAKRPPHCPFCRRMVIGFQHVSAAAKGGASEAW